LLTGPRADEAFCVLPTIDIASSGAPQRSRYLSFLQIVGALGIIAHHLRAPFSDSGWVLVELFFVIAGINMARGLDRDQSIYSYALSRIRRLGPEIFVVWCVVVIFVASGDGTPGMLRFILMGPLFLQNLAVAFFDYGWTPRDFAYVPLWFVGGLLQLQLMLFAVRRVLLRVKPMVVAFVCVGIGTLFRLLVATLAGQNPHGSLPSSEANLIYLLPLTHVEAIVLGVLIGRGALVGIGRLAPFFCAMAIGLGSVSLALSPPGAMSISSLGFACPLSVNYAYVWGYLILALTAASLCSRSGRLAAAVDGLRFPIWTDKMLIRLASLTYGAYAFHALIIATGTNAASLLAKPHTPGSRLLLVAITAVESFLFAWGFELIFRRHRTPACAGSEPPVPAERNPSAAVLASLGRRKLEPEALDQMPRADSSPVLGTWLRPTSSAADENVPRRRANASRS